MERLKGSLQKGLAKVMQTAETNNPSHINNRFGCSFCSLAVLLGLMSGFAGQPAFAQCTVIQFQPAVGNINTPVPLDAGTPKTQNGRTLTRSVSGDTITYTVTRPNQSSVVFQRTKPVGATQFSVDASFIGPRGLLFKVLDGNTVNANASAFFFDLTLATPVQVQLFAVQGFVTDAAVPFFLQNSDGSCLFIMMQSNRSGELQHNVFQMSVFRMDTGGNLCTHPSQGQLSARGDIFGAEIVDANLPAGSDTVIMRQTGHTDQTCSLPVPALTVTPDPLAFGSIANNSTRDLTVTFSNPGQDPVQVSALGSSAHFTPVTFTAFTLSAGQSATRTIRFAPGGVNGFSDENLAITRCPPVGAASVHCTGTGTTPLPTVTITATDATASEPGTDTGRFRISRTGSTALSLIVNLSASGSAVPGTAPSATCGGPDYQQLPASVMIASGSDHTDLTLTPFNDAFGEPAETVNLTTLAGTGYVVGTPSQATVNISDDDEGPVMKIVGRTFSEGALSRNVIVADVILSAPSQRLVTANWTAFTALLLPTRISGFFLKSSATGGTSCGPMADFITGSGQLNFSSCTLTQTILVPICGDFVVESNETFFISLSSPVNAALGFSDSNSVLLAGNAICTIRNDDLIIGSFGITPEEAAVRVHERLNYAFTWTVPEPQNWHDLQYLQFRIRDGKEIILSVLFDEASKTFSLVNEDTGEFGHGVAPGSKQRLQTPAVTLYMDDTSVVASGPTSPTVTLNLSLSFKPKAAGRTFVVEVAASDDFGNQDDFTEAGTLNVSALNAQGRAGED